ncbi:MAG TPA: hypothetical protein VHC18_06600 [Amycolatopsis sp.]|nr:hypothetical protein [Amycolatopsis sp.]
MVEKKQAYRATEIADYLETYEQAAPAAAQRAGAAIAAAWSDREFWWSATAAPLGKCALESPDMVRTLPELVDRLTRRFHTYVHDVPAWEPTRPPAPSVPNWRFTR